MIGSACASSCRGLSLVELLVSTALGLLLTAGMAALYLEYKRHYFYDEQLARLQENGRYATRLLSRELAMAGFFAGSLSAAEIPAVAIGRDCNADGWALDASRSLDMVNDYSPPADITTTAGTSLACLEGGTIAAGSDMLAIKRTAALASLENGLIASGLAASRSERWFLRVQADRVPQWHRIKPVELVSLAGSGETAAWWQAVAKIFYVRRYSDPENSSDDLPTLCVEALVSDAMSTRCLVEGVENLQLELGVDSDGDGVANRFLSAPQMAEMQQVVAVRFYLLLRSLAPVTGYRNEKNYRLGEMLVPAREDGFLRRVFSATVSLRNRVRLISGNDRGACNAVG